MTQKELYTLLKTINLPVAYYSFKASGITPIPDPPYIVYLLKGSDNSGADNKVYSKADNYFVELYTNKKDLNSEELLENLFDFNDIFYNRTETYIETESLFQVAYSIQI